MSHSSRFKSKVVDWVLPIIAGLFFLLVWQLASSSIETSIGNLPSPLQTWQAAEGLGNEFMAQQKAKDAFYAKLPITSKVKFSGPPTFPEQIFTSLKTIIMACVIAALLAVPLGLMMGSSPMLLKALNPMVQILRPISPLAWLPIVTLVVAAVYQTPLGWLPKSFVISTVTVTLCALWPTLINTIVGVSQINPDYINVSRVLGLNWVTRLRKIILPAAMPMIFTGLRLSVGVGWMVLIAADMLAQNPGLGKFIWDEFQNGGAQSLSRILVAIIVIGLIGFLLDRLMLSMQKKYSWIES